MADFCSPSLPDCRCGLELLGIPPGPLVGQAWRYLKELRLELGPLDHDEAVAELYRWADEHGIPHQP